MSSTSFDDCLAEGPAKHGLQSPPFTSVGDFYADAYNVVRGVTLPLLDVPGSTDSRTGLGLAHEGCMSDKSDRMGVSSRALTASDNEPKGPAKHGLQSPPIRSVGDFYGDTDNVVRGVTLPLLDVPGLTDFSTGLGLRHEGCMSDKFDRMGVSSRAFTASNNEPDCGHEAATLGEATAEQSFESSDNPPELQEEEKPHLEATSLHLEKRSPITIGNQLLDTFRKKLVARVNKVNRKKFTIKAEVVHEGHAFIVKARIYWHQHDHWIGTVLDFQRWSGDTVAFHKVYYKVVWHLEGLPCDYPAWDTAVPDEVPHSPEEAIAPLLDMLVSSQSVRLQAEAVSAMAEMASNPMVVAQLRKPCYLSALQQLRQSDDFSVAFPTSRILKALARD